MTPSPDPVWLIPAIVLGFAVVFPLFWCFVVGLVSHIGGWSRLARRFPEDPRTRTANREGTTHHGVSGRIGVASYRHVLTVRTTPEGLHLSVMPLFRSGHPSLFIPWSAVRERHPVRLFGGALAERLFVGDASWRLPSILLPARVLAPG